MEENEYVRHSQAQNARIVSDDEEKAKLEASNSLRQADRVRDYVIQAVDGRPFKLRLSTILDLNRCAIEGLDAHAGNFRPAGIGIGQSEHTPPEAHRVPELIEAMCDYVNDQWKDKSAVHLASFVMWRLNWIHPFTDGNGRTSRAVSYMVLCIRECMLLPGQKTIPEQIVTNRKPYYDALEEADSKYLAAGEFSEDVVSKLETLISGLLAAQLTSAFEEAVKNKS